MHEKTSLQPQKLPIHAGSVSTQMPIPKKAYTDLHFEILPFVEFMWSDYRKSLPGQFIRNRLKIEQNCRLYLDIFSSAIMNGLFMTFASRLKVNAKCVYQQ